MNCLISIIVPTYNRADLIGETLESVLAQSYGNWEVIVVDNHSTDNTEAVISKYICDKRIRYIKHSRNYERARSRNTGLQNATGDFVTFLDSDDFIYPECLHDAYQFHLENPGIKFFHTLYELVDNNKKHIYSYKFPSLQNPYKALASGNFISCIGGFLHKDIYKNIAFTEDPRMIGSEDYEIWFKVIAQYGVGRVNKVNCGIREHEGRSVNNGVYDNLEYQRVQLQEKIASDKLLREKFGRYSGRLNCSYFLMEASVKGAMKQKKAALGRIKKAVMADFSVLQTRRFYATLYNCLK
ncbi:glycosyltransferase family 2 protein [Niabella aurantiaca]|uniref:glycosyltransferase family 2 protein n=1 Tax=Niabella aurantiaca TaxID=379900 RepID=UPI000369B927|nr:glycosyltransferase family 2 protein [Niabella aurantiaca]